MLAELGTFALILTLVCALLNCVLPIFGAQTRRSTLMAFAPTATIVQWMLVLLAYVLLTIAFISHDYSIHYVASNSNNAQPLMYRISAVWGAHEGSLLLWLLMLNSWAALVAVRSGGIPLDMRARVLAVLSMINLGFLSFTLFTSNPFMRLNPAPIDGRELNPLLQDPGLIIHPPMLYMGYVGLSVVFAFAIAALIHGKLDTAWARWARPWTIVAWLFLTIGITLGSWWAYYELGWGGWWFWDPVENASFMPWLVGTALIHSLAVTDKRGALKAWTILLAVLAFSMSLLGTFLVRSGVLTSVHAFASDPARGVFILVFLLIVIGGSLTLYAVRANNLVSRVSFKLVSRDLALLINNVQLVVTAAMVLIGTLAPLVFPILSGQKISVGPPYFDFMFALLMLPLAIIMGIGALLHWKKDRLNRFARAALLYMLLCFSLAAAITAFSHPNYKLGGYLGLCLGLWVIAWSGQALVERLKHQASWLQGLRKIPLSIWGMTLAHIGVGVFIIGVSQVNNYSVAKDVRMLPGDVLQMPPYAFEFGGVEWITESNYRAQQGQFLVTNTQKKTAKAIELKPEKRFYTGPNPMTEAAIHTTLGRDLYVSLGQALEDDAWSVRIYMKPFVVWIWLGGFIMAFGGLIAAYDRRYRNTTSLTAKSRT